MKSGGRSAFLLLGLVMIALNLRPALASVSPVLETIRQHLGLSRAASSLLTTIPVLCMGGFAFVAARIGSRVGLERGVLWAIVLIGVATAGRLASHAAAVLYATTLLVGIGIAVAQALLPAVVKRHFADRAALVTGLYTVGFNAGAAIAAGATVALQSIFDGSWPVALAFWALLAVPATVAWLPVARRSSHGVWRREGPRESLPWRVTHAWLVTLLFASSSCLYWSVLTWLAPLYQEEGLSEGYTGFLLTLFTIVQIVAALVIPALADRSWDRRPWLALTLVMSVSGLVGIASVPLASPWGFTVLIGLGVGGFFPLSLTLPLDYTPDPDAASRLTAMTQGVGFLLAALGPFAVGALRDATGGYEVPFITLAALGISMLALALFLRPQALQRRPTSRKGPQ
jgi:CP family cyanate transporter-like MFS transporter